MTEMACIREFLGRKRLAMVGVSRAPQDFSRSLFREFRRRGYDMVPVHPEAGHIEGHLCFARLQDVQPPVAGALFLTPPAVTDRVVEDCVAAGVSRVWMYRTSGEAVRFCQSHGISVIAGECPLMFLPEVAWFHRFHGWLRKIAGTYPG